MIKGFDGLEIIPALDECGGENRDFSAGNSTFSLLLLLPSLVPSFGPSKGTRDAVVEGRRPRNSAEERERGKGCCVKQDIYVSMCDIFSEKS